MSWLPWLDERADMVSLHRTGPRSSPRHCSGELVVDIASERSVWGIVESSVSASALVASIVPASWRTTLGDRPSTASTMATTSNGRWIRPQSARVASGGPLPWNSAAAATSEGELDAQHALDRALGL